MSGLGGRGEAVRTENKRRGERGGQEEGERRDREKHVRWMRHTAISVKTTGRHIIKI